MKNLYFIIVILFFISCSTNRNPNNVEYEHSLNQVVLSIYDNNYELFIEINPIILGSTARGVAHITKLRDFKPLTNSNISLKFVDTSKNEVAIGTKSVQPGIWSFELTPQSVGSIELIVEFEDAKFIIKELKAYMNNEEAQKDIGSKYSFSNSATHFSKEQSWKIDFKTEMVNYGNFGSVIKGVGKVMPSTDDVFLLVAKSRGTVVWNSSNLYSGREVRKNEHLYTVLSHGFADENSSLKYIEAENKFKKTELEYNRANSLIKDKIISAKEFEEIKVEYENAKAVYEKYKNTFSKNGEIIKSSSNGFLKEVFVKNGEFVEEGTIIASVTKNDNLLIEVDVEPKYSNSLMNISSANFKMLDGDKTYSIEELDGEVISVGRALNSDNFLLPVYFRIKNNSSFISGSFVEVYIKTSSEKEAIFIPVSSLVEEQGNYFVYEQIHPELFEKTEVKLGNQDGLDVEIISGLSKTSRIVTKGATIIKLAESSGELDPEDAHFH